MPFKSKAQRRKFAELLVNGKISDQTFEEWNRSTGKKVLPERLHPEAGVKGRKKTTATKKTTAKKSVKNRPARKETR
jgi:3-deoxy-D-manno-octulosonic-acid transferase